VVIEYLDEQAGRAARASSTKSIVERGNYPKRIRARFARPERPLQRCRVRTKYRNYRQEAEAKGIPDVTRRSVLNSN